MDKEVTDYRYRIGQVVKFRTTLRSGEEEQIFGKIIDRYYNDELKQHRYRMEEYPEKSDYTWDVPENKLNAVSLMEM